LFFKDKIKLKKLENIIHSKVGQAKRKFLSFHRKKKAILVILEIPILFETNGHKGCDFTILVFVNKKKQLKRVLSRSNIDKKKIEAILSNQMPLEEKKKRADFTINNSFGRKETIEKVEKIIKQILSTSL
jgi:dephospho-CoA kinase